MLILNIEIDAKKGINKACFSICFDFWHCVGEILCTLIIKLCWNPDATLNKGGERILQK